MQIGKGHRASSAFEWLKQTVPKVVSHPLFGKAVAIGKDAYKKGSISVDDVIKHF